MPRFWIVFCGYALPQRCCRPRCHNPKYAHISVLYQRSVLDFEKAVPQYQQLAVSADASLWNYAFERNVIITGEQNLFSLLRLLQIAWTQQRQAENQEKVFDMASTLVDRVQLFVERFDRLDSDIDGVRKSFDDAKKAMSGNRGFIGSARKLIDMGAKANPKKKKLPEEVDE